MFWARLTFNQLSYEVFFEKIHGLVFKWLLNSGPYKLEVDALLLFFILYMIDDSIDD